MSNCARRHGFARQVRLLNGEQYNFVFSKSVRNSDRYFTVLSRSNDMTFPRLGLAISKKNIRFATQRNRIKRVIRECFRLHQSRLRNVDVVVMAKPAARLCATPELFVSINQLVERLNR